MRPPAGLRLNLRGLLLLIGTAAILGGSAYLWYPYVGRDTSNSWSDFLYWNLRRGASGLDRPLFSVRVNGLFGFIDETGRMVIRPQFERVFRFQEGVCLATQGGRDGYIDGSGSWVIPPRFVMASNFHEGHASVRESFTGKDGYIDRAGQLVIPYQFDTASDFVGGVARVGYATALGKLKSSFVDVGVDCAYEYIDTKGKRVSKPPTTNPPAVEKSGPLFPFGEPNKMGYKDSNGRIVVQPVFARADPFEDGLGCVGTEGGWKNGYVNAAGQVVWPPSE